MVNHTAESVIVWLEIDPKSGSSCTTSTRNQTTTVTTSPVSAAIMRTLSARGLSGLPVKRLASSAAGERTRVSMVTASTYMSTLPTPLGEDTTTSCGLAPAPAEKGP